MKSESQVASPNSNRAGGARQQYTTFYLRALNYTLSPVRRVLSFRVGYDASYRVENLIKTTGTRCTQVATYF